MNYKLLASDMDGTLLKDDFTMSSRTKKAVRDWLATGLHFVPCTGRPLCGLSSVVPLFEEDTPVIVHHGAMAAMHRSKKLLFCSELEADLVMEVYKLGEERNLPIALYRKDELFFNMDCEPLKQYEEAIGTKGTVASLDEIKNIASKGVVNILWLDYPERIATHQKEMPAHFGDRLNCHASGKWLFEFVAKEATKAAGLDKLIAHLGIRREEVVAVGDSYNDLSMLKYAGFSIAMGNAYDEVKAVCDYVTLSNEEDGVAVWMEGYIN